MRKAQVLALFMVVGMMAGTANADLFSETFSGEIFDNAGWTSWHAPWGNNPTIGLIGESATLSAGGYGSAGMAILVDISSVTGEQITLSGQWGGNANFPNRAWVEVLFYQTDDPDMTDVSSANFKTFDTGNGENVNTKIAVKHDGFGLPDTVWGPQSFADDATNNGFTAGFTAGLTQTATLDYAVIAFKVGHDGTIEGLDNITLVAPVTVPSSFDRQDLVGFIRYYGMTSGSTIATGDFNNDDMTGLPDLAFIQLNFDNSGAGNSPTAVPEPSTLILSVMAMIGWAFCSRRRGELALRRLP